jgi:hypothetical protein
MTKCGDPPDATRLKNVWSRSCARGAALLPEFQSTPPARGATVEVTDSNLARDVFRLSFG